MPTLDNIFGKVKQICFKDDKGVYLDQEKVALDNSSNNGYIRRNGTKSLSVIDNCSGIYTVELPLRFVGVALGADALSLEIATISALTSNENVVISSEIDKKIIAESEGIELKDLAKFTDVTMIMVDFTQTNTQIFDPRCKHDLC